MEQGVKEIFISYSRRDTAVVDHIVSAIQDKGFSVWIDRVGIESGDMFKKAIVQAIVEAKVILFFSSEASNRSEWTVKEIGVAVARDKFIIPIKLDNAHYNDSIEFDLINNDFIDYSVEEFRQQALEKLLRTLTSRCGERAHIEEEPIHHTEPEPVVKEEIKKEDRRTPQEIILDEFRDSDGELKEIPRQNYAYAYSRLESIADTCPEAQYWLGLMSCSGPRPNFQMAMNWFSRALISGLSKANFGLGQLYKYGLGVSKSPSVAKKYFKTAADDGYMPAMEEYAGLLYNEYRPDDLELLKYVRMAVDAGSKAMQPKLAELYLYGNKVERDYQSAFKIYESMVKSGSMNYLYELAQMYRCGLGVEKDADLSDRYMNLAAASGDKRAVTCLEQVKLRKYRDIDGDLIQIDKSDVPAIKEIFELAEIFPEAMYWKGLLNLGANNNLAFNCIKKASDYGIYKANAALSQMYQHGIGVARDPNLAGMYMSLSKGGERAGSNEPLICRECGVSINPAEVMYVTCDNCHSVICCKCHDTTSDSFKCPYCNFLKRF